MNSLYFSILILLPRILMSEEHIEYLTDAVSIETITGYLKAGDDSAAAWCRLFDGKTRIKAGQDAEKGREIMRQAAEVIREVGEDWEREEAARILAAVGL